MPIHKRGSALFPRSRLSRATRVTKGSEAAVISHMHSMHATEEVVGVRIRRNLKSTLAR